MIPGKDDGRLKSAFVKVPEGAKARPDCPPPERLWRAARGELKPAELQQVVLHLCDCPVCTEAWRLAERLENDVDDDEKTPPLSMPRTGRRRGLQMAALAAALLAVIGLGIFFRGLDAPSPVEPTLRGLEATDVPTFEGIELLSSENLSQDDFLIRWHGPNDEDLRYRLRITPVGSMGPLLDMRDLQAREYRVPPELLGELPTGTRLTIWIAARHPSEGRVVSVTFVVTLQKVPTP